MTDNFIEIEKKNQRKMPDGSLLFSKVKAFSKNFFIEAQTTMKTDNVYEISAKGSSLGEYNFPQFEVLICCDRDFNIVRFDQKDTLNNDYAFCKIEIGQMTPTNKAEMTRHREAAAEAFDCIEWIKDHFKDFV